MIEQFAMSIVGFLRDRQADILVDDDGHLREWNNSYARGSEMQAARNVVRPFRTYRSNQRLPLALGWCTHPGELALHLIVMMPTNKRLGALAEAGGADSTRTLVQESNYLHAVRTV